jgi:signal transduction histidine kinase
MDRWIMGVVVGVLLACVAYLLYDVKQLNEQVEYLNDHEHIVDGQYEYQQSVNKHDDINAVFDNFLNLVIELKKLENSELPDIKLEDK